MGNKKIYHMIKWEALSKPKDFGGLGFIDTTAINVALLCKWIYRLESGDECLCMRLLRNKYPRGKSFYQSKRGGSQLWQGMHSVKDWYERGKGNTVERLWKNVWIMNAMPSYGFISKSFYNLS